MKKIIWLIIIFLALFFLLKSWWGSQIGSVSADQSIGGASGTKVFVIAKGASVSEIARNLKENNLIKSELVFKIYVKQNEFSNKLQAGSYKLSPSMTLPEIVKNMQKGSEDIWVTLIEGWRVEEMATELNSKLQIPISKFLTESKEGYMFPDTYLFPKEATVEYIVDILKNTFEKRFTEDLRAKIRSKGLTDEEGVILASIIEREGRSDKVKTEIAGILLKRFKIGMGLNADAAVQYALGYQKTEKSWWKRNLSREDLKIDSSYNTYLHVGLPPTPICNPGLSSIKAVANADPSTPYLYYYHDSKGISHYAKTLEEHNRNVANYP